ncbi:MAG: Cell envelope-related transcriptional attenuator [Patescibacteria group bacterium]|nr:Cell envelope-related transcriptional attenuator [Patescibacteria group bacterium]
MAKKYFIKSLLTLFFLVLAAAAAYGSFFVWKLHSAGKKISFNVSQNQSLLETVKNIASSKKPELWENKERINILLLGIAGEGKAGRNLTDTIMVASINLKTGQLALISIPRDLYVTVPEKNLSMKINSVYQSSLSSTGKDKEQSAEIARDTVEEITSLDMEYYVILDFDGFQKIIDSADGINITNERDIYDARYPGPNYSYETFELEKGFHHLDGATALKYARVRHGDPEGDFGRAKRQQQVIQALKNRIFSTRTLLDVFALNNLFDALGENIKTNIPPEEFESFLELSKKLDTNNINNIVINAWDKGSLLKVSHVFHGGTRAFVLVPRVGNWSEVQEISQNAFDINRIQKRREEIAQENATIAIINASGDENIPDKIKKLLKDNLDYKSVVVINNPENILIEKTLIYELKSGQKPFTLDELALKLPAEVSSDMGEDYTTLLNNVTADVIVVIGKDLIERYNMEEASLEEYKNSTDVNEYVEFRK